MTNLFITRAAPVLVLLALILLILSSLTDSLNSTLSTIPAEPFQDRLGRNMRAGRVMQALYQVEAQAAETGWTSALRRLAGDLWRDAGDLPSAVANWQAGVDAGQIDIRSIQNLAQAYITLGRWTEAAESLGDLLELTPDDLWAHYQLGLIQASFDPQMAAAHLDAVASAPAYSDAAQAILAALRDNPADPLISMRVGVALADHELWPYAELAFQHAADVGQPFPEALAYLALARDWQGKDGSERMAQALALDAQSPQVLYLQGLHLRYLDQYQQSLDAFIQAAALDPQNPAFLAELGTAYRLVDDLPDAEFWLKTAAALSGGDPRFQELLAMFYAETAYNLTSGGLDTIQQTTNLLSDDPDVRAGYGWALYTSGDVDAGLAQLDAALALAPANQRALYYKAQIWLESGNVEGATPLFQQVADSQSEFAEEARRVLEGMGR